MGVDSTVGAIGREGILCWGVCTGSLPVDVSLEVLMVPKECDQISSRAQVEALVDCWAEVQQEIDILCFQVWRDPSEWACP